MSWPSTLVVLSLLSAVVAFAEPNGGAKKAEEAPVWSRKAGELVQKTEKAGKTTVLRLVARQEFKGEIKRAPGSDLLAAAIAKDGVRVFAAKYLHGSSYGWKHSERRARSPWKTR